MDYKDKIRSYVDLEIETLKKLDLEELNLALKALKKLSRKKRPFLFSEMVEVQPRLLIFRTISTKGSLNSQKKTCFLCLRQCCNVAIANDIGSKKFFVSN